ncbi:uncharacterized protein V1516DRAFT_671101 [Lipomyces oligophaga]|uniref:uncharacterized protein n=1 Tax=Lipomyces oligophaga TaxID=45792 RepID=UPI0034CE4B3D
MRKFGREKFGEKLGIKRHHREEARPTKGGSSSFVVHSIEKQTQVDISNLDQFDISEFVHTNEKANTVHAGYDDNRKFTDGLNLAVSQYSSDSNKLPPRGTSLNNFEHADEGELAATSRRQRPGLAIDILTANQVNADDDSRRMSVWSIGSSPTVLEATAMTVQLSASKASPVLLSSSSASGSQAAVSSPSVAVVPPSPDLQDANSGFDHVAIVPASPELSEDDELAPSVEKVSLNGSNCSSVASTIPDNSASQKIKSQDNSLSLAATESRTGRISAIFSDKLRSKANKSEDSFYDYHEASETSLTAPYGRARDGNRVSNDRLSRSQVVEGLPEIPQNSFVPGLARKDSTAVRQADELWSQRALLLATREERVVDRLEVNAAGRSRSGSDVSEVSLVLPPQLEADLQAAIDYHENGDLERSTRLFGQLADKDGANNPLAQVLYGLALRHGWGIRASPDEAIQYFRAAASNSALVEDAARKANVKISSHNRKMGAGGTKGELTLAIFELANCYRYGWGVEQDPPAAKQYYETAAHLGDTDAMCETAWCYLEGFGVEKDKFMAAQFYRMAEQAGKEQVGLSWIWKSKYDPTVENMSKDVGGNLGKKSRRRIFRKK